MSTTTKHLCLTCSSSPSPTAAFALFFTPCCARPICDNCLGKNPRLRGYNPCLGCLAGVALVGQSSSSKGKEVVRISTLGPSGRSQDQEDGMFVLGDSDEEDVDGRGAPPPYTSDKDIDNTIASNPDASPNIDVGVASPTEAAVAGIKTNEVSEHPSQYIIQPRDTLRGIALKFGVDGVKICQLNSLPLSTLSITPQILHTRRVLILPPGKRITPHLPHPSEIEAHERERVEKRFQFVTKEVDWRIAKAYVALAEEGTPAHVKVKDKEDPEYTAKLGYNGGTLLSGAVEQYLADDEWEAGESIGSTTNLFSSLLRRR